ncbi:hypothetical protein [Dyadobacter aurulentus]|uniref:hypothetical protein n=1 Tax=Dyadobacter sp. UC 10 TaxID=2605428 RepID=UPI0011F0CEA1|nr:hypothetical protein [Dyadobacter sp. UC 10]KAA0989473.1 hypothetical protein FXO21_04520 [Dyadobacter sp. UC 10]
MVIERTDKEVIIRLPATVDIEELQDLIDFARYKEITSAFQVDQEKVDALASGINAAWWSENRERFAE